MFDTPQSPTAGATNATAKRGRGGQGGQSGKDELRRAQMELVAARERGETGVLPALLARLPQHAAALTDFDAALLATSGYADVTPTPEIAAIAAAAQRQAFANVFGAPAVAPAPVA